MKVLYVGNNARNVSPSYTMFPTMLRYSVEVVCYGPGFTDNVTMEKGLMEFIEGKNFDIILLNGNLLKEVREKPKKYSEREFRSEEYYHCLEKIVEEFKLIEHNKACHLFLDPWHMTDIDIKEFIDLINKGAYIISIGKENIEKVEFIENLQLEKIGGIANDRYWAFVNQYEKNIVSFPPYACESMFDWTSLSGRKYEMSIVGRMYNTRKTAKNVLKKHKIKTVDNQRIVLLMRILSGLRLRPYNRTNLMSVYSNSYFQCIKNSQYSFACGMRLKMPLSKFFEIPACGAAMIAFPCKGFRDFGFIHGVNAIESDPEEVFEAYSYLAKNPIIAQRIANNGQSLVWEKHSSKARSEQLQKAFDAIINGSFSGSEWNEGNYIIK